MAREDIRKEGNNEENKNQSPKKHRNSFGKNPIVSSPIYALV
jgi:hypothetical protein